MTESVSYTTNNQQHLLSTSPPSYLSSIAGPHPLHLAAPPKYTPARDLVQRSIQKRIMAAAATGAPANDRSIAKTSGGTFALGKKPIELSIKVADNLVFLYPNATTSNTADEVASGMRPRAVFIVDIMLKIPEGIQPPAAIESLTVQLKGLESLGVSSLYVPIALRGGPDRLMLPLLDIDQFPEGNLEQNELTYATKVVQDASGFAVKPGNAYRWEVPVEVDHDVAPYERMRFGRVYQRMGVQLRWANTSFISKYKNLEVDRDVWMTCIPNVSNALEYARTHRTVINQLGPVIIHVRTHHLTVGGYLRIGLSLPSIPTISNVIGIELAVLQSTTLHSRKRYGFVSQCQTERLKFLQIDGDEFRQKMAQFNLANWAARIPTCEKLRPSTLQGSTQAAIRLNHHIEVRIIFKPDEEQQAATSNQTPLVYTAKWPVTLPSCSCRWRSLKLPEYSKLDPSPVPDGVGDEEVNMSSIAYRGRLRSHLDQTDCSCGIPWKDLLHHEDEFDDMQHTCSTRLLDQELMAAAASRTPWPRQNSASSVRSGIGALGEEDSFVDSPPALEPEDLLERKASQQYMPREEPQPQ